jgi:hypothetical protein
MFFSLPMCKMKTRWDLPKKKKKTQIKTKHVGGQNRQKKKKKCLTCVYSIYQRTQSVPMPIYA